MGDCTMDMLYRTPELCPSGWYVPSDNEWTDLTDVLGGETVAGEKMRSVWVVVR